MAFYSFDKFEPFKDKVWLSSPTMHGKELDYMLEAYRTNWMSTVGSNIDEVEKLICDKTGCSYGVALSSGTAALHLAVKLAGEDLYGKQILGKGSLAGHRAFVSDLTFNATVNPIVYEGGAPVFIDAERETWNMDPEALEKAFSIYPDVKLVIVTHLYGTPGKIDELKEVCGRHGAILIEDAAESLGAVYKGTQTGSFGNYNCISFNGNKIITGSSGGMLLTDNEYAAKKAYKWASQAKEAAPWYQHAELGYNYRISNVIAGVVRGQLPYLEDHIVKKKAIYKRYEDSLKEIPVKMNPFDAENSEPNHWLSCITVEKDYMCKQTRGECNASYVKTHGKTCPTEILEALSFVNAEGRAIWKPMHLQPVYKEQPFIALNRANTLNDSNDKDTETGEDIFYRGICLPSDINMTGEQQQLIISVIKACFD